MSQQRYLQQLRSSVQNNKESAINAIQTQLSKANDGSFVLGRYFDAKNGVRTVIGVNARTTNGSAMAIFEFDKIEQEQLIERIDFIEKTLGISGSIADGREVHIFVKNTSTSDITITIPSTIGGKTCINMVGENLIIYGSSYGEINLAYDGSTYYYRGA